MRSDGVDIVSYSSKIFLRFLSVGTGEREPGLDGADEAVWLGVASPVALICFAMRKPFNFVWWLAHTAPFSLEWLLATEAC